MTKQFKNNAFNILLEDLVKRIQRHHPYDHKNLIDEIEKYLHALDVHVEVKWIGK